jgi:hypothetical protein
MSARTWIVPLAFLALAAVTSCGGQPSGTAAPRASSASASPSVTADTTSERPRTALHGSWRLELTEAQLGAALTEGGYGDLTDEFLAAEEIEGAITQVLTVEADRFSFAYQSGGGAWHVGWEGPVTVDGDTVVLQDDLSPTEDTLRWSVEDDQLTLELVEVNDVVLKGLPNEVYLHAYLMAAPFLRTDCVPTSGSC